MQAARVVVEKGKVSAQKPVAVCYLPRSVRLTRASQQHVGGMVMRNLSGVHLISPAGGAVLEPQPSFVWEKVEQADSYVIRVTDSDRRVMWTARVMETSAQGPALTAAATYTWKLTALAGEKPIAATESKFLVLPADERRRIEQELAAVDAAFAAEAGGPSMLLARAAILERAALLSSAVKQYKSLAAVWKDAAWLRVKVAQLEESARNAQRPAALSVW